MKGTWTPALLYDLEVPTAATKIYQDRQYAFMSPLSNICLPNVCLPEYL